jgi:hypothetical protein
LATNLSTLSNILKEYYLGPVAEQLNNEVLLLSRLESKTEDLVGRRAYVPLHWGRSGGVGARAESAALPSAGQQQYEKAVYDLKYLYGRVEVTGPSMAKTKNEAGAFLQALKSELDGIRNDLRKDLARQVYGDGTAKIATATAVTGTSGVTMTVGSEPVRKGQLYPGMRVNVYASGGTAYTASAGSIAGPGWGVTSPDTSVFVISAADITAGTITLNTPTATFAIGDYLVRAGVGSYAAQEAVATGATGAITNAGTYALSDEVDGLQRIVSDSATAFGGITPTGSAFWWDNQRVTTAVVDQRQNSADPAGITGATATGSFGYQDLTFGTVQQGLNKARIAGGMPSSIVTSFGVQREFFTLFTTQVQYIDPKTLDYQQGFKTLSYNGMPVIADIEAPYGKMYILDESTLKVYSDQDWHFLDADGLTLRQVTGYDKFEAIMARYMNIGATRRNNQVVITGISVDGVADAGY